MPETRMARWWELPRARGKQGDIASVQGQPSATIECPKCKAALVVYNGNYFCDGWGDTCDWALAHPAVSKRDRAVCDLLGTDYW